MTDICVIAHNIRSTHNIGSLLRTAEGLGIDEIIISGYSPYPIRPNDDRLPHIASKVNDRIAKTALGAESSVKWQYSQDVKQSLAELKQSGYIILGLEQAKDSIDLSSINKQLGITDNSKLALLLGSEVDGLSPDLIDLTDYIVEIPMFGKKESYNVVEAATMAMYQLRFGR